MCATNVQTQYLLCWLNLRLLYLLVKVCFLCIALWFCIICKLLLSYLILQLFTLLFDHLCFILILLLCFFQLIELYLIHVFYLLDLFDETLFYLFDAIVEGLFEFLELLVFICVAFDSFSIIILSLWSFSDLIYFDLFQFLNIILALLHILWRFLSQVRIWCIQGLALII